MSDAPSKIDDLSPLSALAPMLADMLGLVSNDIALVLDSSGVIQKVVLGGNDSEALRSTSADWVGREMRDTVTDSTRKKV